MTKRVDILSINIDAINTEAEDANASFHLDSESFRHEGVSIGADYLRLDGRTLTRGEILPGSLELQDVIGRGAFSEVRLGLWTRKNSDVLPVAVKDFRVIGCSSERRSMLVKELKALTKVKSEHLIKLYGAYLEDDQIIMVLEYMDLGSLDVILKQTNAMKEAMIAPIAYQLLLGLSDLHDKGIMHRDLKPGNILVNANGFAKLGDFGMASLGEQSLNTTVLGTAKYMAPERLTKSYGRLSDIWSFGLVVVECLTGRHPFAKIDSLVDLLVTVEETDLTQLLTFKCHDGLKEIIACSLQINPGLCSFYDGVHTVHFLKWIYSFRANKLSFCFTEQRMPSNILLQSPWFTKTHSIEDTKTARDRLKTMLSPIHKK